MVINIGKFISDFAMKVKLERTKRGWSQEELGEQANLHRVTIGAIERKKMVPTIDTVARLANAFELTIEEMFNFNF